MAKAANDLTHLVMLAASKRGDVLFKNPVGMATAGHVIEKWEKDGVNFATVKGAYPIVYGLAVGSSDLIGWRSIVVTPDMVGRRVAVLHCPEIKAGDDRLRKEQEIWLRNTIKAGAISYVARSVDDIPLVWEFPKA